MIQKLLVLSLFILLTGYHSKAQLQAHAGRDTFWCTYGPASMGPGIGTTPGATGGATPYTYHWTAISTGTPLYLNSGSIPNPSFTAQPPYTTDSLDYELKVTDSLGAIARDTMRVFFSHFMCITGECVKEKHEQDTVTLNLVCFARFLPATYSWAPAQYLSDPTTPGPTSWTPTSRSYTATITDRLGCVAYSPCTVIVSNLGIEGRLKSGQALSISPNPLTESSTLTISEPYYNGDLILYTVDGKVLARKSIVGQTTYLSEMVQSLATGIYFYQYRKDGKPAVSGKLVVN